MLELAKDLFYPKWLDRLGHRGRFLFLMGVSWILFGVSVLTSSTLTELSLQHVLFYMNIDPRLRSAAWVLTGCIAIAFSFRKKDTIGFGALWVMPLLRCVSYFQSWVASDPLGSPASWWAVPPVVVAFVVLLRSLYKKSSWKKSAFFSFVAGGTTLFLMFSLAAPSSGEGYPSGWVGGVTWLLILLVVINVAGWDEPEPGEEAESRIDVRSVISQ